MLSKKINKMHLSVILILLILIALITCNILFSKSKEVEIAEKFMKKLESIHAINTDIKISDMEFKSIETRARIDKNIGHTINCDKYGISLDRDGRVVGFSKKETKHGNNINITEIEAVEIAKKYLSSIVKEKFIYKEIRILEGTDLPYYNVVFHKLQDEYIVLDKEIVLQIDKYTGELDGYSNSYLEKDIKLVSEINITEQEAVDSIKVYLKKIDGEIQEYIVENIAFTDLSDNRYGLAYIINVKIKMKDDSINDFKFRVNAKNGEIINIIK